MIRGCDIPLDSYRLAQYALQTPCFICEGPNAFDADLCRNCQAPMALARHAAALKTSPQVVSILGASGVGKTVYLGMLMDMLSRETTDMQVLARGAFSITLQQTTIASLSRCEFPEKTPNEPDLWNWIHCLVTVGSRRRGAELIMPDMAGEAILEEVDHPNSYPVIRSLLGKCSGAMLLVDAIRLAEGDHLQEHFAMKVLTFLGEMGDEAGRNWRDRPIALIFTKADEAEACFDDPEKFVRDHAPGVWRQCQNNFSHISFFASGVAGECAFRTVMGGRRVRVPLRIEPRGVRDPFHWMIDHLRKHRYK